MRNQYAANMSSTASQLKYIGNYQIAALFAHATVAYLPKYVGSFAVCTQFAQHLHSHYQTSFQFNQISYTTGREYRRE